MKRLRHIFSPLYSRVQNKIFLPFIAVMILIAALIIYVMTDLVSANVEARVNEKLDKDVRLVQEIISDMEESLAFYAQFISDSEKMAGHIFDARGSRLILIQLLEFLKENEISSNIGGGKPHSAGDLERLGRLGIRTTGLIARNQGDRTELALSAVTPIEGHMAARSVITVSRAIDTGFLQDLRQKTGAFKVQVYYRSELVASSSTDRQCDERVNEIVTPALVNRLLAGDLMHSEEITCGDHSMKVTFAPLTIGFRRDALIAVYESMDDLVKARRNIILTTVAVVGLMLLIIVPIYALTVRHTVSPIRKLSQASKAVAEGKLDQHVPVKTTDEVGELSESFNRMVDDLRRYRQDIESWNRTLEDRVAMRSRELATTQAKLVQSEKLAAVGELAAGIAHELNNPLAGIYAFLQVFADSVRSKGFRGLSEEETQGFQENLVHVEHEIQRCKSIIGSLLTFAHPSENEFTQVNLNKAVADTLAFVEGNLVKAGINVETHFDESIPAIRGDSNSLRQVLLNIIVNARKAMPEGGNLDIVTSSLETDHSVCVSISDTGKGIDEGILDKIFDPFFTTSKPGEGTGLGLSISYGIIRDHGGEIRVESRPGEGSTFSIILPVANVGREKEPAEPADSWPERH